MFSFEVSSQTTLGHVNELLFFEVLPIWVDYFASRVYWSPWVAQAWACRIDLRRFRLKSIALLAGYSDHPELCKREYVAPT